MACATAKVAAGDLAGPARAAGREHAERHHLREASALRAEVHRAVLALVRRRRTPAARRRISLLPADIRGARPGSATRTCFASYRAVPRPLQFLRRRVKRSCIHFVTPTGRSSRSTPTICSTATARSTAFARRSALRPTRGHGMSDQPSQQQRSARRLPSPVVLPAWPPSPCYFRRQCRCSRMG